MIFIPWLLHNNKQLEESFWWFNQLHATMHSKWQKQNVKHEAPPLFTFLTCALKCTALHWLVGMLGWAVKNTKFSDYGVSIDGQQVVFFHFWSREFRAILVIYMCRLGFAKRSNLLYFPLITYPNLAFYNYSTSSLMLQNF